MSPTTLRSTMLPPIVCSSDGLPSSATEAAVSRFDPPGESLWRAFAGLACTTRTGELPGERLKIFENIEPAGCTLGRLVGPQVGSLASLPRRGTRVPPHHREQYG